MTNINELRAADDRTIEFRLKKPYPLLTAALTGVHMMPERIAKTDTFTMITEHVGSGPYKFVPAEWKAGSGAVYLRNEKDSPRSEPAVMWAGGKIANFDRIEWHTIPDPATAAAALQRGEVDWVEQPLIDLAPMLAKSDGVKVDVFDTVGKLDDVRLQPLPAAVRQREAAPRAAARDRAGRLRRCRGGRAAHTRQDGHRRLPTRLAVRQHGRPRRVDRSAQRGDGEAAGGGERLQGRADRADVAVRPADHPAIGASGERDAEVARAQRAVHQPRLGHDRIQRRNARSCPTRAAGRVTARAGSGFRCSIRPCTCRCGRTAPRSTPGGGR